MPGPGLRWPQRPATASRSAVTRCWRMGSSAAQPRDVDLFTDHEHGVEATADVVIGRLWFAVTMCDDLWQPTPAGSRASAREYQWCDATQYSWQSRRSRWARLCHRSSTLRSPLSLRPSVRSQPGERL